jgi:hypothetical protein
MINGVIHNFNERLEHSQTLSDEPAWLAFYKRLWPDLLVAVRIDKDSKSQRWGIDREILLPEGRRVLIDEKKRDTDYGDILLEEWSVGRYRNGMKSDYVGEKVGWAFDKSKRCDFIAYAIIPAKTCYLLPCELLRQACVHNIDEWRKAKIKGRPAYPKDAHNSTYITRNVAVEWPELKRALTEQMLRKFGNGEVLELPVPMVGDDTQLEFDWSVDSP